jgi:hypothetical protein
MVALAALAGACADEDLEGTNAEDSRSITVSGIGANASSVTRPSVTPSTGSARPSTLPVFYRLPVRAGDTVATVAGRFRLRPEDVIWNNEGVLRDGELVEGTFLEVPRANGILHRLALGETRSGVAARYRRELDPRSPG